MESLTVKVIRGRNLTGMDRSGLCDPFCFVKLGSQITRSKVQQRTLEPVWNHESVFVLTQVMLHPSLAVSIDLWDKETIGKEYMGSINIPIATSTLLKDAAAKWLPILNKKSEKCGELLVEIGWSSFLDEGFKAILDSFAKDGNHP